MMQDATFFRAVDHNLWDPEARIADCDRQGVDVQVLSTVPVMFSYWAKPEHTLDLSMILNDHIADILTRYPKRFTGLCTVPMQAPKLAIHELERAMKCGFDGVEIATHINHWNLDDEPLMDFYAAAEELGASIFVHPWDIMAPERMERYWLKWLVGMPAETSLAMASLLMGGVVERFPKLKFAFAHGGGAIGATIGRINHGFVMRPDLCQTHTHTEPKDLVNRLYIDSLVHDRAMLDANIALFGANRIALGTDYPFPLGELEPGELIESCTHLDASVREQLLSGTVLEFLGRKREEFIR